MLLLYFSGNFWESATYNVIEIPKHADFVVLPI